MSDPRDEAERIVRALAEREPITFERSRNRWHCPLCDAWQSLGPVGGVIATYPGQYVTHADDCPWVAAVALIARLAEGGAE